jgi:hypothetical protein
MRSPPKMRDGITTSHDPMAEAFRFADASWRAAVLVGPKDLAKIGCLNQTIYRQGSPCNVNEHDRSL